MLKVGAALRILREVLVASHQRIVLN